ncbi:MAG TPA: hypothetical protein VMB34_30280 [Acetobacteraceae bacterium]|nr:hypothetical protein [Acetobacteraceae bacterium]
MASRLLVTRVTVTRLLVTPVLLSPPLPPQRNQSAVPDGVEQR